MWPGCALPAQRGGRCFRGVGKNYPGSRGNHGVVCSLPALATHCYTFLGRHSCCGKDLSLQHSVPAMGRASVPRPRMDPLSTPLLSAPGVLRKEWSAPCLLCNAKTLPNLLYSACLGLQNTCWSWIAGAMAPYLADGACKAHPARSHMERQRIYKIST